MKQADVARTRSLVLPTPATSGTSRTTLGDREHGERPPRDARCASPPSQRGSAPSSGERGGQLRRAADVDVHRPHRQRDREHGGRVAPGAAEADGDEVGQRHLRRRAGRDADRGDGERAVEDGDDARRRAPSRAAGRRSGRAELAGELRHRLPADERARRGCSPRCRRPTSRAARTGVQLSPARDGSATLIATAITTTSTDESASWKPAEIAQPEDVRDQHGREHREADERRDRRFPSPSGRRRSSRRSARRPARRSSRRSGTSRRSRPPRRRRALRARTRRRRPRRGGEHRARRR